MTPESEISVLTSKVESDGTSLGSLKLSIMAFFSFLQEVNTDPNIMTASMRVAVSCEMPME